MISRPAHSSPPLLAAIEAGGTKYVCAVATDPSQPLLETRFPTGDPHETVARVAAFFHEASALHGPIHSLGIGTFGPARLDPAAPDYGTILTTPKEGWSHFPLVTELKKALGRDLPVAFETDVTATVATFTVDSLAYSPSPPVVFAVCDFDGGGRLPVELTDVRADQVSIGMQVEMVTRLMADTGPDGLLLYAYKFRPVL